MKVVDIKDFEALSGFFKGEKGHRWAEFIMRLLAIDKVNRVHDRYGAWRLSEKSSIRDAITRHIHTGEKH